MTLIREIDFGTPAPRPSRRSTLTIDGETVTVPAGTSIMRAAMEIGHRDPEALRHRHARRFGSCRLCLVEIEGRAGTPASCTTPVARGHGRSNTQTRSSQRLRRGVMELYISDHPLDCLTCAANGDCELQDMAGAVGLREVRYALRRREPRRCRVPRRRQPAAHGDGRTNPYFTFDPAKCIVCYPLRPRLRRGAGHVRADDRGPRLRQPQSSPGMDEDFLDVGVRVLRRLRAGLPDRLADREGRHRDRHARALDDHHLRLLRRRLHLQGRDARRGSRPHGAVEGRQGQPRPLLRQGPLRLRLRHPPGARPEADGPRARSPTRGAR